METLIAQPQDINFIWRIDKNINVQSPISNNLNFSIFGTELNFEKLNWHKDYKSNFIYPKLRFDKIKLEKWYNQGIDVKFPWELSRFYFGVLLGQKYLITKNKIFYETFKKLVSEWIKENPFLYGVNWVSTMESSIRAINWIIALNFFSDIFDKDEEFRKRISISMIQHAEYIFTFPEIYENNLTTNHTTAGFTGLLFLGLTLKGHLQSAYWIETAISGLEKCIEAQVYEDGGDFEGSIPYHRLVLEFFSFSAIVCSANSVSLSNKYYSKLFRMFEFTSAYIDRSGNAPQVGDNDSGRCLILESVENEDHYFAEHDHSYLLQIGQQIFNYIFLTQCRKKHSSILQFLPKFKNLDLHELNITPVRTDTSICFPNFGAYLLKNEAFSFLLSCFQLGQNGKGGHNHLDKGSYTLSINGRPIITDAGTLTYTADKKLRNKFRSYSYHNTLFAESDGRIDLEADDLWSLKNYYDSKILKYTPQQIEIGITLVGENGTRHRRFGLEQSNFIIEDKCEGIFFSRMNFHPDIRIVHQHKDQIEFEFFELYMSNVSSYQLNEYDYSNHYGKAVKAKCLIFSAKDFLNIRLSTKP